MGRPRLAWTAERRAKWLAAGRGSGDGAAYKSWLTILDAPASRGIKSQLPETRHGRLCNLFSSIEHRAFLVLDYSGWRDSDLYDQYRLDLEETKSIAQELSIDHPRVPDTGELWDMTTDLVGHRRNGSYEPFSCKERTMPNDWNQIEHTQIERVYWKRRSADLKLILDDERTFPTQLVDNLKLMSMHRFIHSQTTFENGIDSILERFLSALRSNKETESFLAFCNRFAALESLPPDQGFAIGAYCVYRNLAWANLISQDLRHIDVRSVTVTGLSRFPTLGFEEPQ